MHSVETSPSVLASPLSGGLTAPIGVTRPNQGVPSASVRDGVRKEIESETEPKRSGIFTTGIVCEGIEGGGRSIRILFTGRRHAGENLGLVLDRRAKDLPPPLTKFLKVAGVPLDNNVAERLLKGAILHRKNSLHYKTQRGRKWGTRS